MSACQPILATSNPLFFSGVREVLALAGVAADPQIVTPAALGQTVPLPGRCLVILDGLALPHPETLARLCRSTPESRFVLWVTRPTADALKFALDCGVHGLLSANLPRAEAAAALVRICAGERILRFDPDSGAPAKPLRFSVREQHVLRELANGANNAHIAAALQTSASAVKGNLSRLFHKTGTRNRRELAQLTRAVLRASEPTRNAPDAPSLDALWMLESL
jgi:DNA-binding NarL/FixJ family response regulator